MNNMKEISFGITVAPITVKDKDIETIIHAGQMVKFFEGEGLVWVFRTKQKILQTTPGSFQTCDTKNIEMVENRLWLILLAVKSCSARLQIIRSKKFCDFLNQLGSGSRVSVSGHIIDISRNEDIVCSVGYVGPVPEIGPGIFFGFIVEVSVFIVFG